MATRLIMITVIITIVIVMIVIIVLMIELLALCHISSRIIGALQTLEYNILAMYDRLSLIAKNIYEIRWSLKVFK